MTDFELALWGVIAILAITIVLLVRKMRKVDSEPESTTEEPTKQAIDDAYEKGFSRGKELGIAQGKSKGVADCVRLSAENAELRTQRDMAQAKADVIEVWPWDHEACGTLTISSALARLLRRRGDFEDEAEWFDAQAMTVVDDATDRAPELPSECRAWDAGTFAVLRTGQRLRAEPSWAPLLEELWKGARASELAKLRRRKPPGGSRGGGFMPRPGGGPKP